MAELTTAELKAVRDGIVQQFKDGKVTIGGKVYDAKQIHTSVAALVEERNTLKAKVGELEKTPMPDPPKDADTDVEQMSNTEFGEHLMKQFEKKLVSPLNARLDSEVDSQRQLNTASAVDTAAKKEGNEDFWDWEGEMTALSKEHPSLPPEDLLHLARARSPERMKEMSDKKAEETKKEEEGKKGAEALFGGLTPTSSVTQHNSNMEPDDAIELAWQQEMSGLGEVLTPEGSAQH